MTRIQPTRFVFQPVQLVRPCEVVAYRIAEAIRAGDVKLGERLPSEQSLSAQLGVSRPTLREAIKVLVQAGLVEVLPGSSGGIFVTSESVPPELCGFPLPDLNLEDIDSVMEARRLFEPHVARLAALYATPADFERMREAVRLSEAACEQVQGKKISDDLAQRMTIASTRFNIAVARATQNSMIVQMMEGMLRRVEWVRTQDVRERPDISQSTRTLRDSLLAIESGDPAQIDTATAARIGLLESAWEQSAGKRLRRRTISPPATPVPTGKSHGVSSGR